MKESRVPSSRPHSRHRSDLDSQHGSPLPIEWLDQRMTVEKDLELTSLPLIYYYTHLWAGCDYNQCLKLPEKTINNCI